MTQVSSAQLFGACIAYHHRGFDSDAILTERDALHRRLNLAGVIPIIGIVVALFRVVLLAKEEDDTTCTYSVGAKITLLVRGILELLGLGIVPFLLVDMPMDLYHECRISPI